MVKEILLIYRAGFLQRQKDAKNCDSPIPTNVFHNIAELIRHVWNYQGTDTVPCTENTRQIEANVVSTTDE